jgi:hypothetical protein
MRPIVQAVPCNDDDSASLATFGQRRQANAQRIRWIEAVAARESEGELREQGSPSGAELPGAVVPVLLGVHHDECVHRGIEQTLDLDRQRGNGRMQACASRAEDERTKQVRLSLEAKPRGTFRSARVLTAAQPAGSSTTCWIMPPSIT